MDSRPGQPVISSHTSHAKPNDSSKLILSEYGYDLELKQLMLTGYVDSDMLDRTAIVSLQMDLKPGDVLTCIVATPGGCMYNGLGIYDLLCWLRETKGVTIRMIGVGYIMSMGTVLIQAASPGERVLLPSTSLMVHLGHETIPPDTHPNERKRITAEFDRISDQAFAIVAARMGVTLEKWKKNHALDTYFSAEKAVSVGLADSIIELEVPRGEVKKRTRRKG